MSSPNARRLDRSSVNGAIKYILIDLAKKPINT